MHDDDIDYQLTALATSLRSVFRRRKSERDKRPYKPHKRFDDLACWTRIAKLTRRLGATPEDFMEAQFRFSKSALFANTLHGPTAEKRYKQFLMLTAGIDLDGAPDLDVETIVGPGKADLLGMITDTQAVLTYTFGSTNILRPEVKKEILSASGIYDPLVIMLLAGTDADYRKEYLVQAREILRNKAYLKAAALEIGFNLEPILNENFQA